MGMFIRSPQFAKLNVGFCMDEGLASRDEYYNLYYAERAVLRKEIHLDDTYLICDNQGWQKHLLKNGKILIIFRFF